METNSIDLLNIKLRNAPQSILDRVIGYVDALVEPAKDAKPFSLTHEQLEILNSQLSSDKSTYTEAETLYSDLKNKYGL